MVDPLKTEISVPDSRQSGALLDVGSARGKNKRSLGRSGGGTGDTTAVEDPALARTQVTRDRGEVSDGGDETREEPEHVMFSVYLMGEVAGQRAGRQRCRASSALCSSSQIM